MRRGYTGGIGKAAPVDDVEETHVRGQCSLDVLGEAKLRRARIRVADKIGVEFPHALDERMPKLAGKLVGRNPYAVDALCDLLDKLGLLEGARPGGAR